MSSWFKKNPSCPLCVLPSTFIRHQLTLNDGFGQIETLSELKKEFLMEKIKEESEKIALDVEKELLHKYYRSLNARLNYLDDQMDRHEKANQNKSPKVCSVFRDYQKQRQKLVEASNMIKSLQESCATQAIDRLTLNKNPYYRAMVYEMHLRREDVSTNIMRHTFGPKMAKEELELDSSRLRNWLRNEIPIFLNTGQITELEIKIDKVLIATQQGHIHAPEFEKICRQVFAKNLTYINVFCNEFFDFASSKYSMDMFFQNSRYKSAETNRNEVPKRPAQPIHLQENTSIDEEVQIVGSSQQSKEYLDYLGRQRQQPTREIQTGYSDLPEEESDNICILPRGVISPQPTLANMILTPVPAPTQKTSTLNEVIMIDSDDSNDAQISTEPSKSLVTQIPRFTINPQKNRGLRKRTAETNRNDLPKRPAQPIHLQDHTRIDDEAQIDVSSVQSKEYLDGLAQQRQQPTREIQSGTADLQEEESDNRCSLPRCGGFIVPQVSGKRIAPRPISQGTATGRAERAAARAARNQAAIPPVVFETPVAPQPSSPIPPQGNTHGILYRQNAIKVASLVQGLLSFIDSTQEKNLIEARIRKLAPELLKKTDNRAKDQLNFLWVYRMQSSLKRNASPIAIKLRFLSPSLSNYLNNPNTLQLLKTGGPNAFGRPIRTYDWWECAVRLMHWFIHNHDDYIIDWSIPERLTDIMKINWARMEAIIVIVNGLIKWAGGEPNHLVAAGDTEFDLLIEPRPIRAVRVGGALNVVAGPGCRDVHGNNGSN